MSREDAPAASEDVGLTDHEIITIQKWMPLISPTDYTKPWSETLEFAKALLTCPRRPRALAPPRGDPE